MRLREPSEPDLEHWIEHPPEPQVLVLVWRPPFGEKDRVHWAVGELARTEQGAQFRYYGGAEFARANGGRTEDMAHAAGFRGYPSFDLSPEARFEQHALDAFLRRLPPRSRADFPAFMEHFRVPDARALSDIALLGVTAAKLPSDGFALIDPLDPAADRCETVLEVAGHRHYPASQAHISVGDLATLVPEPDNPHDPQAVRIDVGGQAIGHVSRLQAATVGSWLSNRQVQAWLLRKNGTADAPRAYIFVSVSPRSQLAAA
jgi:hypothetical protein